jgi:tetratricopeptide (TPR) repeat protein
MILLSALFLLMQEGDLRQGLAALNRNDLIHAREFLENAAKRDPRSALVWVALAQTYLKSGQKDLALESARRAGQFGADAPPVEHALALFYEGNGDFAEAAGWERRFAAAPGASAETAASAASLSLEAAEPEEAVKWAQVAVHGEDSLAMHHLLGKAYQAAGKPDSALPELRRAAGGEPSQDVFIADYGQALLERRDFANALTVLGEGRQRFPKNPQIALSYGVACYAQRRYADAVSAFLEVIRLDPSIEQPYVFLGRIPEHAGNRLPEIAAAYTAWERRAPDNYLPVFLHAKALLASPDPDIANVETMLRGSIQLNEAFWESHLTLGTLLAGKGKLQEAQRELSRSIELNPREARAHYDLARVYFRLGKPEMAQAERAEYERLNNSEDSPGLP